MKKVFIVFELTECCSGKNLKAFELRKKAVDFILPLLRDRIKDKSWLNSEQKEELFKELIGCLQNDEIVESYLIEEMEVE